jgi:hypothetical protein
MKSPLKNTEPKKKRAINLGVTIEVFRELTTSQKRIVQNNDNKDMMYVHSMGNPRTHAQTIGWKKYKLIKIKQGNKGYILIKK